MACVVAAGAASLAALLAAHGFQAPPERAGDPPASIDTERVPGLAARRIAPRSRAPLALPVGPARLRGLVVASEGKPAAGIRVEVTLLPQDEWVEVRDDDPDAPNATVVTETDGTFTISSIAADRRFRVHARPAPPRISASQTVGASDPQLGVVRLLLEEGTSLIGRVIDAEGAPLSGARAAVSEAGWEAHYDVEAVESDTAGAFVFPAVPALPLLVKAAAPGVGSCERDFSPGLDAQPVILRIGAAPGAIVEGRIRAADGAGVAGARILATVKARESRETITHESLSSADGTYRIERVSLGDLTEIAAEAVGFERSVRSIDGGIAMASGQRVWLDVVLESGVGVEGRVYDEAGRGIEGLIVEQAGGRGRRETTDFEGRFAFKSVPPGPATLQVKAPGWTAPPGETDEYGWIERVIYLRQGIKPPPVEFAVRRIPRLLGTVLDEAGHPAAFAGIEAWGWWPRPPYDKEWTGYSQRPVPLTVSDDQGRFELPSDVGSPGQLVIARTETECSDPTPWPRSRDGAEPPTFYLRLRPGAALKGRIVDASGRPVEDITEVCLSPPSWTIQTRADGTFAWNALPAGRCRVFVWNPPGEGWRGSRLRTYEEPVFVTLVRGEPIDVLLRTRHVIDPPSPRDTIEGVAVDLEGRPVAVTVTAARGGWPVSSAISNALTGQFVLDVPAGLGDLVLDADGEPLPGVHRAGDHGVRILHAGRRLSQERWLECHVAAPDGRRVSEVIAALGDSNDGRATEVVEGRFQIRLGEFDRPDRPADARPTTLFVLGVRDELGREMAVRPWSSGLLDPRTERVEVALEAGRSVTGRVLDDAGEPVIGASIHVESSGEDSREVDGRWSRQTATDERGSFRIEGLPFAEVKVHVQPLRGSYLPVSDQTVAREASEVAFQVERGGEITGRVLGPDGEPVAGCHVYGARAAAEELQGIGDALTGADGQFRLAAVPKGVAFALSTWSPRTEMESWKGGSAESARAGDHDVILRLTRGPPPIVGEIVTSDGVPVVNGTIRLTGGDKPRTVTLDGSDSRFRFALLPVGTYSVVYEAEHSSQEEEVVPNRIAVPGSEVRLVVLGRASIRGRLLGTDLAGFRVAWVSSGKSVPPAAEAVTEADGTFALHRLSMSDEGTLSAARDGDDRCAREEHVRPGTSVAVDLRRGLVIEGRLLRLPAGGASDVLVFAYGSGVTLRVPVRDDATFQFVGLPPGPYRISVQASRRDFAEASDVQAGTRDLVVRPWR